MAAFSQGRLHPFQPQIDPAPGEGLEQVIEIDGGRQAEGDGLPL
jgi:hypothetical protein